MDNMPEVDEEEQIPTEPQPYFPKDTQYYADFNALGNIIGFYVNDIHGDNIPELAMPITVEEWQLYSSNASLYKFDGEVIREKTVEEIEAEAPDPVENAPTELDRIGEQLVQRELEALELRNQNGIIGGQLVEKELQIMDIKAQNESLSESLVGFELRLLSLETPIKGGEETNV